MQALNPRALELEFYRRRACPPRQLPLARLRLSQPNGSTSRRARSSSTNNADPRARAARGVTYHPATEQHADRSECPASRTTAKTAGKFPETDCGRRPTDRPCSDIRKKARPATSNLTKSLTRARWGLRRQTTRIAELRAELERREARAAQYRGQVATFSEQLAEVDPDALDSTHDVSGGAR